MKIAYKRTIQVQQYEPLTVEAEIEVPMGDNDTPTIAETFSRGFKELSKAVDTEITNHVIQLNLDSSLDAINTPIDEEDLSC